MQLYLELSSWYFSLEAGRIGSGRFDHGEREERHKGEASVPKGSPMHVAIHCAWHLVLAAAPAVVWDDLTDVRCVVMDEQTAKVSLTNCIFFFWENFFEKICYLMKK